VFDPVYITGGGLVTVAGRSASSTFDAICDGFVLRDHTSITSSAAAIGAEAAEQALSEAGWSTKQRHDPDTGLIVCSSKGPVLDWLRPAADSTSDKTMAGETENPVARASRPCLEPSDTGGTPVLRFGLARLTTDLADSTGIRYGPRLLASAACASGLHGLARAVMMLRSGQVPRALVIATEASVHPLFLGSFQRLGVLCPPKDVCRPFDENRRGFFIADAAAAVCLELKRPAGAVVSVDRIAIAGDATHLTGSAADGRVIRHVLRSVIAGKPVDFVHAHGTGTVLNDAVELAAVDAVASGDIPVTSHKAALGHTLGASSLVSFVLAIESHRRGAVPPTTTCLSPIQTRFATVSSKLIRRPITRSVVTAAGFGGAVAAIALQTG
jgi:3-oxoacyl-[acyl-carrier-protein] synthase II